MIQAASQNGKFRADKIPHSASGSGAAARNRIYSEELLYRRFFAALILTDLVTEVPLREIVRKYGVDRGPVQALQTTAASFWCVLMFRLLLTRLHMFYGFIWIVLCNRKLDAVVMMRCLHVYIYIYIYIFIH